MPPATRKVVLDSSPFPDFVSPTHALFLPPPTWPAHWIALPDANPPFVSAYKLEWSESAGLTRRVHVTADERYELWLDGRLVGRGAERSQPFSWAFDTYDFDLAAGRHLLVALVWALGSPHRPRAQDSLRPGIFLSPDDAASKDLLATGHAPWRVKRIGGREFLPKGPCFGTSAFERQTGEVGDVSWRLGQGTGWTAPVVQAVGSNTLGTYRGTDHRLRPSALPAMLDLPWTRGLVRHLDEVPSRETSHVTVRAANHRADEAGAWQRWWKGEGSLTFAPHTRRRAVIDLEDYVCGYPELHTRGGAGAFIRWHTAEGLYATPEPLEAGKANRDEIEGRHFIGWGDEYLPDGGDRVFAPLWWRCGRYVEIVVETAAEPLTLHGVSLRESRYPYAVESRFESADTRLLAALSLCERTMAMSCHDAFLDPYYEQLMYFGDTCIEAVTMLATHRDPRLVRHAVLTAHRTRWFDGLTSGNVSSAGFMLPTFSLYWIVLVHDYLWWREDRDTLAEVLPGVRASLDYWLKHRPPGDTGLVVTPPGFNFVDWVAWSGDRPPLSDNGWHTGTPPGALPGQRSVMLNWQLVWTIELAHDLETLAGETELAARWRRLSDELVAALLREGWSEEHGAFADDVSRKSFSQHTQLFALLSGRLPPEHARRALHALMHSRVLEPATLSFSYYLLEVLYRFGEVDALQARLEEWRLMPTRGFKTCYEIFWDSSRSDCHAWSSHPLYHTLASILGVRPGSAGFATVRVAPLLRPGEWARGAVPHPRGEITADLARGADGRLRGKIHLPAGLAGEFVDTTTQRTVALSPGANTLE